MRQIKTKVYFFLILFLLSVAVYGQKFTIGVSGGPMVNWAGFGEKTQKDTFSTAATFGFNAGFQIGFPLKNRFQLMLEGGYASKARAILFNRKRWENHTRFNMAEGSMLLRKTFDFHLGKNVPATWFFDVGPEIDYIINARGRVIVNDGKPNRYTVVYGGEYDYSFDKMFYENANRFLFGLVLGIGFKAPLHRNQFLATQIRFTSGHTFLGTRKSDSIINLRGFQDTLITNIKAVSLSFAYNLDFDVQRSRKGKSTIDRKRGKN
jgi:hypothetical protein